MCAFLIVYSFTIVKECVMAHTPRCTQLQCVHAACSVGQELYLAMCMFNVYHNGARFQIINLIKTRACSVTTITLSCSYEVFKAFCSVSVTSPWSDASFELFQPLVLSAVHSSVSTGLYWFCSSTAGTSEQSWPVQANPPLKAV